MLGGVAIQGASWWLAMKPSLLGLLALILLFSKGADAADIKKISGCGTYLSRNISLFCDIREDKFAGDSDRCCHSIAAANELGCFCVEVEDPTWSFIGGSLCGFEIFLTGSLRCSHLTRTNSGKSARRLLILRGQRNIVEANNSWSTLGSQHVVDDMQEGSIVNNSSAEPTAEFNVADKRSLFLSLSKFSDGIMAGFGGCLVISCLVVCPCAFPKKRQELKEKPRTDLSSKEHLTRNLILAMLYWLRTGSVVFLWLFIML